MPDTTESIESLQATTKTQSKWIKEIQDEVEFLNNLTQSNFVSITGLKLKQPDETLTNLNSQIIPDFNSLLGPTPLNNFIPENGFAGDQNKLLADANTLLDDLFRKVDLGNNPKPVKNIGDLTSTQSSILSTTSTAADSIATSTTSDFKTLKTESYTIKEEIDYEEDYGTNEPPNYRL